MTKKTESVMAAIKAGIEGLADECACGPDDLCPFGKTDGDERCSLDNLLAALVDGKETSELTSALARWQQGSDFSGAELAAAIKVFLAGG